MHVLITTMGAPARTRTRRFRQTWSMLRRSEVRVIGVGIRFALVGVSLMAVPGTILSVRAWRTNGAAGDPSDVVITRRAVAQAAVEVSGGVVGLGGGIAVALAVAGPAGLALMALAACFGAAGGMLAGNRLARRI